jgi:DNA-directed RNA polymerase sigma subunit (sigma70/sigma32)
MTSFKEAAAKKRQQVKGHVRGGKLVQQYAREADAPSDLDVLKKKELELWREWKTSKGAKKKELAGKLLKSFDRLIHAKANVYLRSGNTQVPKSAILFEFKKRLLQGLERYDPTKGATLATYVTYYLNKPGRFVKKYQNAGRIPEHRIDQITPYKAAITYLDEHLDRPPTHDELANYLGWPIKEVARMASEQRKDLVTSGFEADPTEVEPAREEEVFRLIQYELTPEELQVLRHTFGISGAPKLSPGEIGRKFKMNPSKVSRIRKKLRLKMEPYL